MRMAEVLRVLWPPGCNEGPFDTAAGFALSDSKVIPFPLARSSLLAFMIVTVLWWLREPSLSL